MATRPKLKPAKVAGWRANIESPDFAKKYGLFAVALLLATTLFWGIKGALLQLSNADELIYPHLFEHARTLKEAVLPGAHTFLLKWPLFWLIKLFGYSNQAFVIITVTVVLATVAGLVWIIYRLEQRPLVFGTLCLALASVLLLVPPQPYSGALLPVNMAMLATRNLEYLFYVFSLILFIKSPRIRTRGFWVAAACLGLLIASDRLFLVLSAGASFLALLAYALTRGWKLTDRSARWLVASLGAAAGAAGLLWLIQAGKVTHTASSAAGPYGLVHSLHNLFLGLLYVVMGLFTNFGANPAYDATFVRRIPHEFFAGLTSLGGPAYLVNLVILAVGTWMACSLMWLGLTRHRQANKASRLDNHALLAIMLLWSSLAAAILFVATNHYYAVDARYLGIALFAGFISAAVYTSRRSWSPAKLVLSGVVLVVSILFGLIYSGQTYSNDNQALDDINQRNTSIAQALQRRHSNLLVGDYWRVLPVKQIVGSGLNITPLDSCTQPGAALSSQAWQPDLFRHGFAYLLSLDHSLTGYPHCTLNQIIAAYGRPNASTIIAGRLNKPKELLLFYDLGAHHSSPTSKALPQGPSTVVPVSFQQLLDLVPGLQCNVPTVMNIVAHQDDDLLFMNPDLLHAVKAGYCVRTIYVTAGDAGNGKFYWLGREQGSEAAYSLMAPQQNLWVERLVRLSKNEYATIASMRNNPKIALVFMHLPDGNLKGEGFKTSKFESLQKLEAGKISTIHSIDSQSSYTSSQLIDALSAFMNFFQPTEIRTQANYVSQRYPDHSDHMAVGRYVKRAYAQYEQQRFENTITVPLKFYIGYPVHAFPANVFGSDLQQSSAAYFAYAHFDQAACKTMKDCEGKSTFGLYLQRQYQNPY